MPPAQSDHDSDSPHLHLTKHDETGEPLASLIAPLPNGQNIMLCWDMESFEEFVDALVGVAPSFHRCCDHGQVTNIAHAFG